MKRNIANFFDKLEDKTRAQLSRYPFIYAFIGGVGVVLFWRGVWHIADDANLDPFISIGVGTLILLVTGVFVSAFIGSRLIISGLSGEKKLTEKTKEEIDAEEGQITKIQKTLNRVEEKIEHIESELENK
jgi:hypothetical protein